VEHRTVAAHRPEDGALKVRHAVPARLPRRAAHQPLVQTQHLQRQLTGSPRPPTQHHNGLLLHQIQPSPKLARADEQRRPVTVWDIRRDLDDVPAAGVPMRDTPRRTDISTLEQMRRTRHDLQETAAEKLVEGRVDPLAFVGTLPAAETDTRDDPTRPSVTRHGSPG
jgi:hypothetical protein